MSTAVAVDDIACTNAELIFLASLRGARFVAGVDDPFRGRAPADVEHALGVAGGRLLERGYLIENADGSVRVDERIVPVVDTVVAASRSFFAFRRDASSPDMVTDGVRRIYHVRAQMILELEGDAHDVVIRGLSDLDTLASAVLAFWGIDEQTAAGTGDLEFEIPQQILHAASSSGVDAAGILERAGVTGAAARAMATTLAQPRRNCALLPFRVDRSTGNAFGLGMLEGANGMWCLRSGERGRTPVVSATPCDARTMQAVVRDFVAQHQP